MIAPTPHFPPAKPLSPEEMQAQIHQSLQNKLTGQVSVAFLAGKTLTLFVQNGWARQVYVRNHRLPDTNWGLPLYKYGAGNLEIESLPARMLLFRKIVLEELEATKQQASGTIQLKTMFDLAERNASPTLFHIRWNSAEGFVLVAGKDIPIRHAVMVTKSVGVEGSLALEQISAWEEARCTVAVHRGNIKSQAWFEVYLNLLLEYYCARILDYYGQMTGKVMIQAIVWKIHTMSVEAGWNLESRGNMIKDATVFPTARDAGDAYKKILAEIIAHIDPVVGHALTHTIISQAYDSSRGVYKSITEVFEFPEETIA